MDVLSPVINAFTVAIQFLRPAVFAVALVTAGAATISWATRTRRVGPFSVLGRFSRKRVDPLFQPMERRLVRAGGTPASAPWWSVGVVVVGGLLVLWLMETLLAQLASLRAMTLAGPRGMILLLLGWTFSVLRLALIVRVVSSWVGGSRYSKWWRWSFRLTDWFLIPLQRVLPTLGPIDISPIVAYFGLNILEWLIGRVL